MAEAPRPDAHGALYPHQQLAASATTQDALQRDSKTDSPIANRVCTPLGLFVHPTPKGEPISLPQTLTPESTQSPASPSHARAMTKSTSPVRQPGASPTRSRALASDCMRRRTDSVTDALRQATAANTIPESGEMPSPLVPDGEMAPLHTGSVLANTKIVHPKPLTRTPVDTTSRPGTASSVAQLEFTAQKLSMTSSIDDAIRDLHGELKRSDSRRSSILAAANAKLSEDGASTTSAAGHTSRHMSTSSSIVSTNTAARQGGYSPAAFVKSPGTSMTARLIPGSLTPATHPETEGTPTLSRQGPGKSSVRSVRSAKLSLADISESEPISLTQDALDEADRAPPIEMEPVIDEEYHKDEVDGSQPHADGLYPITQQGSAQPDVRSPAHQNNGTASLGGDVNRPASAHSQDTYHQAQHAFYDFDGVHCPDSRTEADEEEDREPTSTEQAYMPVSTELAYMPVDDEMDDDVFDLPPLQMPQAQPFSYGDNNMPPPPQPVGLVRPQSYIDPSSGIQMNYYPARVPATLNIPQKLSNKPKAHQRNARQSKVLSAMMDTNYNPVNETAARRASAMPKLGGSIEEHQEPIMRPMKERHHERRPSFLPLSAEDLEDINEPLPEPPTNGHQRQESHENLASTLRIPKRISEPKVADKRKSRMSMMSTIPSQLRATAYFDSPAATSDMEAKDGSAMNALDDVLDASTSAPVGAFTDHLYAGKLGSEVYGAAKKRATASSPSLRPPSEHEVKKRSSMMWLGRRSHSYNSQESRKPHSDADSPRPDDDGEHVIRVPAEPSQPTEEDGLMKEEEPEEEEPEDYVGAPTTLLAELQLRKQQQKERIQTKVKNANGMHATLLELDAIAETQRVDRKSKRVNLVWEDPEAHLDQNGSDDEDVPLAIIAARQQGAKNMADLERPMGLIEKREIEENEPLSRRRARLQGLDKTFTTPRPQSRLLGPSRLGETRPRSSVIALDQFAAGDVEGETLADRRRRLAADAEQERELSLPPTRPVSAAFSAELLSQFDPLEAGKSESNSQQKDTKGADGGPEEEETLGQRRRRLQAEKAARQQEMAHGASGGANSTGHTKDRRMSMASVLSAHPRKSPDIRVQEEMRRREEEERQAREQDAKMAAMRLQMPSTLSVPGAAQSRQFQGGMFNNGFGGRQLGSQHPVTAQVPGQAAYNHPNGMMYNNGQQQGVYMSPYTTGSSHNFGAMNMYGNARNGAMQPNMHQMQMQTQLQMPHNGGSMDRVEVWRQSVFP